MKKIILLIGIIGLIVTAGNARISCKYFGTQAEAQRYYNEQGKGYRSLDRDHDGEACECLPGGSAHGRSYCRR